MSELEAVEIAHQVAGQTGLMAGANLRPIIDALRNATAKEREACAKACEEAPYLGKEACDCAGIIRARV